MAGTRAFFGRGFQLFLFALSAALIPVHHILISLVCFVPVSIILPAVVVVGTVPGGQMGHPVASYPIGGTVVSATVVAA